MRGLIYALRPLAWDFLSTIIFAALTALHVDVRTAAALSWGAGLVQLLVMKLMRRPIPHLQWAGLGLALVFGAASMVTKDPRFVMVKPTLIYLAIAAVMLKRGWMLRYLPPIASGLADEPMVRWGYVWSALMLLTGVANLVVAVWFAPYWPAFLATVPMASKLGLFAIQYVTVRRHVRGRIRAGTVQPQAA
jgi:intracellular septation protein A